MGRLVDLGNRKRLSVGPGSMASYTCPECGWVNQIQILTTIRYATPVRTLVRCTCGVPHTVYLERRAARKQVNLAGTFGRFLSLWGRLSILGLAAPASGAGAAIVLSRLRHRLPAGPGVRPARSVPHRRSR